jgi:thiol-disulfide isomerase/thioredoxin
MPLHMKPANINIMVRKTTSNMTSKRALIYFILFPLLAINTAAQNKVAQAINSDARRMKKYNGEVYCSNFQFIDTAGKKVTLDQFKGRNILVNLWFIGCMPCMAEIPFEKKMYNRFSQDTNLTFLNICIRQKNFEHWKSFTSYYEMPGIQLMIDENVIDSLGDKIYRILKTESFPTYLLLNSKLQISGYNIPAPSDEIQIDYILFHLKTGRKVADLYKEFMSQMQGFNAYDTGSKLYQWIKEFYKQEPMDYFMERAAN